MHSSGRWSLAIRWAAALAVLSAAALVASGIAPRQADAVRRGGHRGGGPVAVAEAGAQEREGTRNERLEVPPPPFSDGIFPCSGCHASLKPNRSRRALAGMHADIELKHDEQHRWCLDCHDADNRDVLHLAGGEAVTFDESYRLCGQCHGEKLRDWRAGVHGRRTGEWNGRRAYLLCAHCHDPHQPRFKSVVPEPAPRRPERPR